MDNFVDFLANHVVMNITTIRNAAADHNGQCTWHFSQCKDPVRSVIAKAPTTKDGICEILAAKWVVEEFHGRSFKTLLAGATGHRDDINIARLSLLAQTFGTGYGAQEVTTEAWMRQQGVAPRGGDDMGGAPVAGARKIDPDADLIGDLRRKLGRWGAPLLMLITVAEQNRLLGYKGHIMALQAQGGGQFKYFDPNYGEFAFPSGADFKGWFLYYFRKSHYQKFMGTYYKLRYF